VLITRRKPPDTTIYPACAVHTIRYPVKECTLAQWLALFQYVEDAGCLLTNDEKRVKTLAGRRVTFAGNSSLKRIR